MTTTEHGLDANEAPAAKAAWVLAHEVSPGRRFDSFAVILEGLLRSGYPPPVVADFADRIVRHLHALSRDEGRPQ
jgi:hypothetical protein